MTTPAQIERIARQIAEMSGYNPDMLVCRGEPQRLLGMPAFVVVDPFPLWQLYTLLADHALRAAWDAIVESKEAAKES